MDHTDDKDSAGRGGQFDSRALFHGGLLPS